jgi:hypothetical protein
MVLNITKHNNINTDIFKRRWYRLVDSFCARLVLGTYTPSWLRILVDYMFDFNLYNDGASPARPYIVFTEYHPGRLGTSLYPEAIRAAMTDIYGGVTLILYEDNITCNHGYEQEVARTQPTPANGDELEHYNHIANSVGTTVAGVLEMRDNNRTVNIHMSADSICVDGDMKSLVMGLLTGEIIGQCVVIDCVRSMTDDYTSSNHFIRHWGDIVNCMKTVNHRPKIPLVMYDSGTVNADQFRDYLQEHYGLEVRPEEVLCRINQEHVVLNR